MKISTHEKDDVVIVDPQGRLTLGEGTNALREKMWELTEDGYRSIILNMSDVTYMDSSALGELVAANATVTSLGGRLKLLKLGSRTRDLLTATKLYMIFDSYEDEAEAIASFEDRQPVQFVPPHASGSVIPSRSVL